MPSDTHAGSRRKRLFAAYIRSACPGRQAQRKMGARCALILGLAERVYHSHRLLSPCTYFIIYICFFLHYGFCAAHQVCALRKLAHPVHLKMHRCVIPLSPPQKKEPLGLLFCGGESGIRTHEALYGGLHDFESCAFNRAPPSLQLRLPFNNTLFYPDCKAFILTFQPPLSYLPFPSLSPPLFTPYFPFLLLLLSLCAPLYSLYSLYQPYSLFTHNRML